jgi:hypothetical protein
MTEINGGPYKITKKVKYNQFCIDCDVSSFGDYDQGGFAKQKKMPTTLSFKKFADSLQEPYGYESTGGRMSRAMMLNPDMWKWQRSE